MQETNSASPGISSDESLLKSWEEDGYVVKRNFFDPWKIDRVNQLVNRLWDTRGASNSQIVMDANLNTGRHRRILFRDAEDAMRHSPYKLNDLYLEHEEIRDIVLDPSLSRVISMLIGGRPMVINTLNFEFGSQQDDHVDTFYMPPRKRDRMLATWIALEPITLQAGPIRYYPKSHKIPPYLFSNGRTNVIPSELPGFYSYMQEEMQKRGIEAKEFTANAGDLFIWHAQLLHGGTPILDLTKTRRSLVTHYFRRSEYQHLFWRVQRVHDNGFYYKRPHQRPS